MGMADVVEYLLTRRASTVASSLRNCFASWAELQRSWELSPKGQCLAQRTWYIKEEEMTLKWSTSTCAYFNFYSSLIQCGLVAFEAKWFSRCSKAFLTSHLTDLKPPCRHPQRGYEIHLHRFPLPSINSVKWLSKGLFSLLCINVGHLLPEIFIVEGAVVDHLRFLPNGLGMKQCQNIAEAWICMQSIKTLLISK